LVLRPYRAHTRCWRNNTIPRIGSLSWQSHWL